MDDWTQDPRFNHFWANYKHGQSWFLKHQVSYWRSKAVAVEYENSMLHWMLENPFEFENQSNLAPASKRAKGSTFVDHPENQAVSSDCIEMEITGDMLEFFALSMKHKKEREKSTQEDVTYINVDEIPIERVVPESQNAHCFASFSNSYEDHQNYSELYGMNASRIQAMETAIQLNFNRNCDRKQPKLWPNMPLHI